MTEDDRAHQTQEPRAASTAQDIDHDPSLPRLEVEAEHPSLDVVSRWGHATDHAEGKVVQLAAHAGTNDAKSRWRRALFLARQLSSGRGIITGGPQGRTSPQARRRKILETQHWLEVIDSKHRYGSNLKYYHKKWIESDTRDNFFQWLDYGEGKDLDLPECSREQLEKERIIYLSAEQSLKYLTKIDKEGRLRWSHNDEFVDTTPNKWKDAGHGEGIIPTDGNEDDRYASDLRRRQSFDSMSDSSSQSSAAKNRASHYAGDPTEGNVLQRIIRRHFTAKGAVEKLLRKTVQKNTWIYSCDLHYNLFVGIKETGVFQHSSFFPGPVASAGLLTIKDGLVTSFSPLSGHYRTSISHFEEFITAMDERGLDLHKIHITRAEAILWGIEHFGKFKKKEHKFVQSQKHKMKETLQSLIPGSGKSSKRRRNHDASHQEKPTLIEPTKERSRDRVLHNSKDHVEVENAPTTGRTAQDAVNS